LVVDVDEERRDEDLPSLEAELVAERELIEKDRELELARRMEELEGEIAELESEGAKDADIKARQKQADKDLAAIRERWDLELDVLQRAFDEFKGLFSRQIIEDEMLWRELEDRYGEYFTGGMGADAIKSLIAKLDFDEEEEKLRAAIDPQEGQRPLSAQRKQKAIKRLKIVSSFNQRDEHGKRINDPGAMILD
ncbi:MAG: DNA-directed RNA polymerase subunit beta', partial [Microthrixaceae bacterium]|nr:DNA-directed RNA polymerase subunit beta' [Microthrixaceae bacterium]